MTSVAALPPTVVYIGPPRDTAQSGDACPTGDGDCVSRRADGDAPPKTHRWRIANFIDVKWSNAPQLEHEGNAKNAAGEQAVAAPQKTGKIANGLLLTGVGTALIASASIGLPHLAPVTSGLLCDALRFCGLAALSGACECISEGANLSAIRGSLLTAGGATAMVAAYGTFGHIGGLTAFFLGLGGFFATCDGLHKFAG